MFDTSYTQMECCGQRLTHASTKADVKWQRWYICEVCDQYYEQEARIVWDDRDIVASGQNR